MRTPPRKNSEDARLRRAERESELSAQALGRLIVERRRSGEQPLSAAVLRDIELEVNLIRHLQRKLRRSVHGIQLDLLPPSEEDVKKIADMFAQYVILLEQEDYWATGSVTQPWLPIDCVAAEESRAYENFYWALAQAEGYNPSNPNDREAWTLLPPEQTHLYQLLHRRLYGRAARLHKKWLRELGLPFRRHGWPVRRPT